MAADYGKKVQADNAHLSNMTSSKFVSFDGTTAKPYDSGIKPKRLGRIVIAAKGVAFTVRSGSRQIAVFATTSPEGTYNFGIYCENGLTIDGVSGTGSVVATIE